LGSVNAVLTLVLAVPNLVATAGTLAASVAIHCSRHMSIEGAELISFAEIEALAYIITVGETAVPVGVPVF
jgi:hypothetical protein